MRLIKIKTDHFVIVSDEIIKVGDWYLKTNLSIEKCDNKYEANDLTDACKKITHSTWVSVLDEAEQKSVIRIDLSEIKELIGEVDVEEKASNWIDKNSHKWSNNTNEVGDNYGSFRAGYNQCLRDNGDKKFTEYDIAKAFTHCAKYSAKCRSLNIDADFLAECLEYLKNLKPEKSLKPDTEWEVEFDSQKKLKLK